MFLRIGDTIQSKVNRYDVRKGDRLKITGFESEGIWVWNKRTNSASYLYNDQYIKGVK